MENVLVAHKTSAQNKKRKWIFFEFNVNMFIHTLVYSNWSPTVLSLTTITTYCTNRRPFMVHSFKSRIMQPAQASYWSSYLYSSIIHAAFSTNSLHSLCTFSTNSLHSLCTFSTNSLHSLCTFSTNSLHSLCTFSTNSLHSLCTFSTILSFIQSLINTLISSYFTTHYKKLSCRNMKAVLLVEPPSGGLVELLYSQGITAIQSFVHTHS